MGGIWTWIWYLPTSLTLAKEQYFKDETEDDIINVLIINSLSIPLIRYLEEDEVDDSIIEHLKTTPHTTSNTVEIERGKYLNINPNLIPEQNRLLIHML